MREPPLDAVVVGAGVAGLVAASLLARAGRRVVVLEAHDKPGGCAGFYEKGGFALDAGATTLVGLDEGDPLERILSAAGVRVGTDLVAEPVDGVVFDLPSGPLFLGRDAEVFESELRRSLPGSERFFARVRRDADALWRVARRFPRLPLTGTADLLAARRLLGAPLLPLLPTVLSTVADVERSTRAPRSPAFRSVVDLSLLITVQSPASQAPWWSGALGLDLFRRGVSRPRGGMRAFALALSEAARRQGAELRFRTRVTRLGRSGGGWSVRTAAGEELRARAVVAALPVDELLRLLSGDDAPRAREAARGAGEGWGALTLNLGLDRVVHGESRRLHRLVLQDPSAPPGDGNSVFASFSPPGDPAAVPGGQTLSLSTHTDAARWAALSGDAYRERKAAARERMLSPLLRAYPSLEAAIVHEDLGTPRTFRRFARRDRVGGLPLRVDNSGPRSLDPTLGLPGLTLAGDTAFPGQGTLAVAISGLLAAERLGAVRVGGDGAIRSGAG